MAWLRKLVASPWLNLVVAAVLILTGIKEMFDAVHGPEGFSKIGVHHGIILFGLVQFLKVLPDLFEAAEYLRVS